MRRKYLLQNSLQHSSQYASGWRIPRLFICSVVSLGLLVGVGADDVVVVMAVALEVGAMAQVLGAVKLEEIAGETGFGDIDFEKDCPSETSDVLGETGVLGLASGDCGGIRPASELDVSGTGLDC